MKKLFIPILLSIAVYFTTVAQNPWQNHFRSDDIEINYQSVECHDHVNDIHKKIVALQFINITNHSVNVSFNKQQWRNGNCIGCDNSPEHQFTVKLNPGQILTGNCEDKRNKALYVVDRMLNVQSAPLSRFELANIRVSIIR